MDLASSPYQPGDDLDLDLDLDQPLDIDNLMDEPSALTDDKALDDTMDADYDEIVFQDDEMQHDDNPADSPTVSNDLNLNDEPQTFDVDDDILYDDEPSRPEETFPEQDLSYNQATELYEEELLEEEEEEQEQQQQDLGKESISTDRNQQQSPKPTLDIPSTTITSDTGLQDDDTATITHETAHQDTQTNLPSNHIDTRTGDSDPPHFSTDLDPATETANFDETAQSAEDVKRSEEEPQAVDATEADQPADSHNSASPQQQPLDLIKLCYLDEEMSFFPTQQTQDSHTFFLSDPYLAFSPLDQMLKSCRELLSDAIGHDDEVVLDIPPLGLHICEDSKYASEITLSQILNIHIQLNKNQSETEPSEPLYCLLSTRVCLKSQLKYIEESSKLNRTYSEIAREHDVDSPYDDETHEELLAAGIVDDDENAEEAEDNNVNGEAEVELTGAESHPIDQIHEPQEEFDPAPNELTVDYTGEEEPLVIDATADVDQQGSEALGPEPEQVDHLPTQGEVPAYEDTNFNTTEATFGSVYNDEQSYDHANDDPEHDDAVEEFIFEDDDEADAAEDPLPLADTVELKPLEAYNTDDEHPTGMASQAADNADVTEAVGTSPEVQDPTGYAELEAFLAEDTDETVNDSGETIPAPITPSKMRSVKRKVADEEDELDVLEFDTPDPKRRRPS